LQQGNLDMFITLPTKSGFCQWK